MRHCSQAEKARQGLIFAGGEGSRMQNKRGLSKHMLPVAILGQQRPLLSYVIDRLAPWVDEVIVGVRYRAQVTERYLHRAPIPCSTLRLPALNNLPVNVHYALRRLLGRLVCFFYGDTLISHTSMGELFKSLADEDLTPECPLLLLLGFKPSGSRRTTYVVGSNGQVQSVCPSSPADPWRFSTLAAVALRSQMIKCFPELDEGILAQSQEADYTLWPAVTRELLKMGLSVRAVVSSVPSVNVNTRKDLLRAEAFLKQDTCRTKVEDYLRP